MIDTFENIKTKHSERILRYCFADAWKDLEIQLSDIFMEATCTKLLYIFKQK